MTRRSKGAGREPRRTRQRAAIRRVFEEAERPIGPSECLERAAGLVPRIGIATVYRNIRRLVDEEWLRIVALPGGPDRYEVAGKRHHHHFECRECNLVFDVDACPGDLRQMAPGGFRLEAHEIILYGLCPGCGPG
jgi:Fur family ferric uptake transcriptional regulator